MKPSKFADISQSKFEQNLFHYGPSNATDDILDSVSSVCTGYILFTCFKWQCAKYLGVQIWLQKPLMRVFIAISNPEKDPVRCRLRSLAIKTDMLIRSQQKSDVSEDTFEALFFGRTSELVVRSSNFQKKLLFWSAVLTISVHREMATARLRRAWNVLCPYEGKNICTVWLDILVVSMWSPTLL